MSDVHPWHLSHALAAAEAVAAVHAATDDAHAAEVEQARTERDAAVDSGKIESTALGT